MSEDKNNEIENVNKKLDLIIAILLAKSGMTRKEIGEILGISDTTVKRMFAGKFEKIKSEK
mgnify:CR=1 FL=1